jgi:probable HAF family extracellular repeat protein
LAIPITAAEFKITDIAANAAATAINSKGEIAGSYAPGIINQAFKSGINGFVDLGTLGGTGSTAYGINEGGFVVGHAGLPNHTDQAFIWNGQGMVGIGTLGGFNSVAFGISSSNLVVGRADTAGGVSHAFVRDTAAALPIEYCRFGPISS